MTSAVYIGGSLQNQNTDLFTQGYMPAVNSPRTGPYVGTGSEDRAAWKIDVAGAASFLTSLVTLNGQTSSTTVTSRVNLGAGNQTITIGAGGTGQFQDTTHSDALVAGNTINIQVASPDPAHEIVMASMGLKFQGTSVTATLIGSSDVTGGVPFNNGTSSATKYMPAIGSGDNSNSWYLGTETSAQDKIVAPGVLSRMGTDISSNSSTNGATITFRKNAGAGNQTISIGASSTGYIEDTTHTDAVIAGDLINLVAVSGAGTVNANQCFMALTFTSNGTSVDMRLGNTNTSGQGFSSSVANYMPIAGGNLFLTATESNAQTKYPYTTTMGHLIGKFTNSTGTGAQNLVLRKGGATGNQAISIDPAAPGTVQDTTHTDAISSNDLLNLMLPAINNGSLSFSFLGLTANDSGAPVTKKRRTVFSTMAIAA